MSMPVNEIADREKIIAAGPIPPRAAEDRSICSRTMGLGVNDIGGGI
jgi:hypothetical protein